jgi:hypothetical protein
MDENRTPQRKTRRTWKKFNFSQAFKQAPWRTQVQMIGLFFMALVVVLLIASIYLTISGQAAAAGLTAYNLNSERRALERSIADQKADLASITSATNMEKRAEEMGFEPADPDNVIYVVVPGYTGKQTAILAPPPGIVEEEGPIVKSIYRQSLWDWLFQGFNRLSSTTEGE